MSTRAIAWAAFWLTILPISAQGLNCADLLNRPIFKSAIEIARINRFEAKPNSSYRGMVVTPDELENILVNGLEVHRTLGGRMIFFSSEIRGWPKEFSKPWELLHSNKTIGIIVEIDSTEVPLEPGPLVGRVSRQDIPISKIKEIYVRRGLGRASILVPLGLHMR